MYGGGNIPLERVEAAVPTLMRGEKTSMKLKFVETAPLRVKVDVLRPTGFPRIRKSGSLSRSL